MSKSAPQSSSSEMIKLAKSIVLGAKNSRLTSLEDRLEEILNSAYPKGLDVTQIRLLQNEILLTQLEGTKLDEVVKLDVERIEAVCSFINYKYSSVLHFYPQSDADLEDVADAVANPSAVEKIRKYKQDQYKPDSQSREALTRIMMDSWLEKNPFLGNGNDLSSVKQLLQAAYPDPNPDAEVRIMTLIFKLAQEDEYSSLRPSIKENIERLISLLELDQVHDSELVRNMFLSANQLGFANGSDALLGFVRSTKFNCLKKVAFAKVELESSDLLPFLNSKGVAKYTEEFHGELPSPIELYNCLYLSGRTDELGQFVEKEFVAILVKSFSPEKQLSTSAQEVEVFKKLTTQGFVLDRSRFFKAALLCDYFATKINDKELSEEEIEKLEIPKSLEGGDDHLTYEDVLTKLKKLLPQKDPKDEDILDFFSSLYFAPLSEDNKSKLIAFWKSDKNIIAHSLEKEGGLLNFSNGLDAISAGCSQNIGNVIRRVLVSSNLGKDFVDNVVFVCFYDRVVAGILSSGGDVMDEYSNFENPSITNALISCAVFQQELEKSLPGVDSLYHFLVDELGSMDDDNALPCKWWSMREDMPSEEQLAKIAAYLILKKTKGRSGELGEAFKDYELSLEGLPQDFIDYVSPAKTDVVPPPPNRFGIEAKKVESLVARFQGRIDASSSRK